MRDGDGVSSWGLSKNEVLFFGEGLERGDEEVSISIERGRRPVSTNAGIVLAYLDPARPMSDF